MGENPALIVTCKTGAVEQCIHEVGNTLFHKDQNVRIERTKYEGVLLVYTSLGPERAYKLSYHREYGFVKNVIPVHCTLESALSLDQLVECLKALTKPPEVKLKVRSRGVRGLSKIAFKLVAEALSKVGIRHNPQASKCLYVEIFSYKVYIGLGDCLSVFKSKISND